MPISSEIRTAGPFLGDGTEIDCPFSFKVFSASDLVVVETDADGALTNLVLNTDYTVALNPDQDDAPGGTVTLTATDGSTINITSDVSVTQGVRLTNGGGFFPDVITGALDRLTILVQQLKRDFGSSIAVPFGGDYFDIGGKRITNVGYPTDASDAATKGYADFLAYSAAPETGYLTPEMFGAASAYSAVGDDTSAVQSAIEEAASTGKPLRLTRMYRCGEVYLPNTFDGLTIFGHSGNEFKNQRGNACGFEMKDNGQNYILKLGSETSGSPVDTVNFSNICFSGKDYTVGKGLLWLASVSQGIFLNCSWRRARGPLLRMNKAEDLTFINPSFALAGNSDGIPVVCFDTETTSDNIGNNAIRFIGGRSEFHDGPHMGTLPGALAAWASSVFISGMKFEAGSYTTTDSGQTYGTNRASYYIFDFRSAVENRLTFRAADCLFSQMGTANAAGIATVGACDDFVLRGNQISSGNGTTVNLFNISDASGNPVRAKNFIFEQNNIRNYSTDAFENITLTLTNKNQFPITYEHPTAYRQHAAAALFNDNPMGLIYASRAAIVESSLSVTRCVTDPDPVTDPSLSPAQSVLAITGAVGDRLMYLAPPSTYTQTIVGYSPKFGGLARVFVRAKKVGHASDATLLIKGGSMSDISLAVTSGTWQWLSAVVNLETAGSELRLSGSSSNNAAHTVYVDAIRVEPIGKGEVIQEVSSVVTASASGTTQIPSDNTKPQNTEGDQYLTVTITPKSANSTLRVEAVLLSAASAADRILTAALFRDSGADALASGLVYSSASIIAEIPIKHDAAATAATATTFKVRAGTGSGGTTFYLNRPNSGDVFNGTLSSFIRITEIAA